MWIFAKFKTFSKGNTVFSRDFPGKMSMSGTILLNIPLLLQQETNHISKIVKLLPRKLLAISHSVTFSSHLVLMFIELVVHFYPMFRRDLAPGNPFFFFPFQFWHLYELAIIQYYHSLLLSESYYPGDNSGMNLD